MSDRKSTNRDYYNANREKIRQHQKAFRHANPEKMRAQKAASYLRNKEHVLQKVTEWSQKNPEKKRQHKQDWYTKNRAVVLAKIAEKNRDYPTANRTKVKKWRRDNPGKHRNQNAKRRAIQSSRIVGDQKDVTAFYELVSKARRIKCHWCGKQVKRSDRHVDHIVPLCRGGVHGVLNLCCSCSTCNVRKHDKLPAEFTGQHELLFY